MLSEWSFVVCQAILHIDGYVEDLEPSFLSASGGNSLVLGSVTNIALVYDIVLKEMIEQALCRSCHVCFISWVLIRGYGTVRSLIDCTCHTKWSRRI